MKKQKVYDNYPVLFVIGLELQLIIVCVSVGAIIMKLGLPEYYLYGSIMLVLSIITFILINKMKWWKKIGFNKLKKKHLLLLTIPAIPLINNLLGNYSLLNIKLYFYYFSLTVLVGFVEEGIFRGLILQVLLKKGVWKALLFSSLLFSLSHIMNALVGWNLGNVLLQLLYSFAIGFGWAAFALRTGTIWPLMIIHGLTDFFSFIKSENLIKSMQSGGPTLEGIIFQISMSIIFIMYGIMVTNSYIKNYNK